MITVAVSEPRQFERDGRPVVSASIDVGDNRYEIWARVSEGPVASGGDAFLVATVMPSMKLGAPLRTSGRVSPRLLENIPRIQEYCHAWDEEFQMNPVEAEAGIADPSAAQRGVGCFFSGGVDSFFSLLKHQSEITHLIFVHGFDIGLDDTPLHTRVLEVIRGIAAEFGKPLIEVETNLRKFSDRHIGWDPYHGAGAAFVAHVLSSRLRKVYFAGGVNYTHLKPFASNPFLLSLWSSHAMNLVGDGYETTRLAKAARVAQSELALRTLRVCWKNPEGAYNCGYCEKCLRTMVSLRIVGALDRCSTFDRPLDLGVVAAMRFTFENPVVRSYWEEHLSALEQLGSEPQLARAVRDFLSQRFDRGIWRLVRKALDSHPRMRRLGWHALARLGISVE